METGIDRLPPVSVILPKEIRGLLSGIENIRACEIEVKSIHGKAEYRNDINGSGAVKIIGTADARDLAVGAF